MTSFAVYLSRTSLLLDAISPESQPTLDEHPNNATDKCEKSSGPMNFLNSILKKHFASLFASLAFLSSRAKAFILRPTQPFFIAVKNIQTHTLSFSLSSYFINTHIRIHTLFLSCRNFFPMAVFPMFIFPMDIFPIDIFPTNKKVHYFQQA